MMSKAPAETMMLAVGQLAFRNMRNALEGMIMEWDRLAQYGSPMAKAANERVAAARIQLMEMNRILRQ